MCRYREQEQQDGVLRTMASDVVVDEGLVLVGFVVSRSGGCSLSKSVLC